MRKCLKPWFVLLAVVAFMVAAVPAFADISSSMDASSVVTAVNSWVSVIDIPLATIVGLSVTFGLITFGLGLWGARKRRRARR